MLILSIADEKDAYSEVAVESENKSSELHAHVINTDAPNDPIAAKVAALKAAELGMGFSIQSLVLSVFFLFVLFWLSFTPV